MGQPLGRLGYEVLISDGLAHQIVIEVDLNQQRKPDRLAGHDALSGAEGLEDIGVGFR